MPFNLQPTQRGRLAPFAIIFMAVFFVLIVGLACNTPQPGSSNAQETEIAFNVRATNLANAEGQGPGENPSEQADIPDYQATEAAQKETQIALDMQATINAQQAAATDTPEPDPPTQEPAPTEEPDLNQDFDTWMRSASILIFEDMAGDFSVYRYIKLALDGMSLDYTDVRDALGHYKTNLLSGGPGGQGWDLIISGKERRTAVQGEFYVYLNDALNLGSSVIIEEWDMDAIASGKIAMLLSRCGIGYHRNWIGDPLNEQLLFPVNGTHPVHHFPNEGISLTNPSGFWLGTDLGDFIRIKPGGDAKILWVARANVKDSYGTAATCMDGRLIFQTYSTHSYGQERVVLMWQNYIYNTLKARYDYLAAH